jgi:small-conductance mechanosensitive channel
MHLCTILQFQGWDILTTRFRDLAASLQQGAVNLLLAIAVGLVGWGVATLAAWAMRALLRVARFNDAIAGLFGDDLSARHEPSAFAAWATYWLVIAVTALLALDTLGFNISGPVSARLTEVVPRIVTAAAILVVGLLMAMLIGGLTRRFFETAGIRGARPRGQAVTILMTAFTALIALDQLGFAAQFVMALGIAGAAAVGLAFGLAFGLGCRDLARDFVIEYLRSLESEGPKRPS